MLKMLKMFKEQIASNAQQTLKIGLEGRAHVFSFREEIVHEVSESTPLEKGKKKVAEMPKYDVHHVRHYVL